MPDFSSVFYSHAWEVLVLFLIPIGGGIPAGVVVAAKYGLSIPVMCVLYFISDVVLACAFEPLMLLFIRKSKTSPKLQRIRAVLTEATKHSRERFGLTPGPFALILITFGTDPMTGRSIAKAVGHGFLTGWALTIAGDMIFFAVILSSTLFLNNVLGDGTLAALIIMVLMIAIPSLIRKWRGKR
jgi:hypothetical protein